MQLAEQLGSLNNRQNFGVAHLLLGKDELPKTHQIVEMIEQDRR